MRRSIQVALYSLLLSMVGNNIALAAQAEGKGNDKRFALYMEGSGKSLGEKEKVKGDILKELGGKNNQKKEFNNVQGTFTATAFCIAGFVKKLDYNFSAKNVKVATDIGVDCSSPGQQCRGWQLEARPFDVTSKYDVSLKLQCSVDDTWERRSQSSKPNFQDKASKK